MAKFKVGDKVRVKKDLKVGNSYYMEDKESKWVFIEEMLKYEGKVTEIEKIDRVLGDYCYFIKADNGSWKWTDEMLELVKEKPENEILKINGFSSMGIKVSHVIFNGNATILFYQTPVVENNVVKGYSKLRKVVAKCMPEDEFNRNIGIQVCTIKAFKKELNRELKKI